MVWSGAGCFTLTLRAVYSAKNLPADAGLCPMTKNDSSLPPEESRPEEPLSTTGMFRRAFGANPEEPAAADVAAPELPGRETSSERPAVGGNQRGRSTVAGEVGEFTRLFQKVQPASGASSRDSAPQDFAQPDATFAGQSSTTAAASSPVEPGEFTRVFLGPSTAPTRSPDSAQKSGAEAVNPVRPRGFSSHGASESAAAEGSVTQLFRAPSSASSPSSQPDSRVRPTLSTPPTVYSSPAQGRPGTEDLFRAPEASARSSPRITNLIESLAMPAAGEPIASTPASVSPGAPPAESGGVTQFIQKLAEEPPTPAVAPSPSPVAPGKSAPGEYTRMVARAEEKAIASASAEPPASAAPFAARPVAPATPVLPVTPSIKAPPMPTAIAPPTAASLPQKKTKLETMAPVLLAFNTVLLLAVVLLLILLLRSH